MRWCPGRETSYGKYSGLEFVLVGSVRLRSLEWEMFVVENILVENTRSKKVRVGNVLVGSVQSEVFCRQCPAEKVWV